MRRALAVRGVIAYDTELATTLTEILWCALYFAPIWHAERSRLRTSTVLNGDQVVGMHRGPTQLGG
jgi:hypothetical protein